jgi:hypothetical protein
MFWSQWISRIPWRFPNHVFSCVSAGWCKREGCNMTASGQHCYLHPIIAKLKCAPALPFRLHAVSPTVTIVLSSSPFKSAAPCTTAQVLHYVTPLLRLSEREMAASRSVLSDRQSVRTQLPFPSSAAFLRLPKSPHAQNPHRKLRPCHNQSWMRLR